MILNDRYWTYYFQPKTGWSQVLLARWTDNLVDHKREQEGRIYTNELQAKAALTLKQQKA